MGFQMKIENDGVRLVADYDGGIRLIGSVRHAQCKISNPRFSAHFVMDGQKIVLDVAKPDAVSEDQNRITVTYTHKIGGLASRRVQLEIIATTDNPHQGVFIFARLSNLTDAPIYVDHIKVLNVDSKTEGLLLLGHGVGEWRFFKHGFQSFSASGTLRIDQQSWRPRFNFLRLMEENITNRASRTVGDFISEQVTQVTNSTSGHVLLAGFTEGANTFGDVRLVVNTKKAQFTRLTARSHFDGAKLSPGDSIQSEPFFIAYGSRSTNLLEKWADIVGRQMDARVPAEVPTGWCSWYYYYTKISEDEVLANLNTLAEKKDDLDVQYVQIDDGYQSQIGDWLTTNQRFDSGMEDMARRINSAGFVPGIWTAPFYARPKSRLFKEHKDWFLKNRNGRLVKAGWNPMWGGKVYALDTTHPGTQGYLAEIYSSLKKMGYRFFKCDFLYAATLPAARHNPHTTRAEALRIGLEIIRNAIGDDSFLLGCGCPIMPAVGIVDGMRIGMDVAPIWDNWLMARLLDDRNALCTHHNIVNTINRAFMHKRLFLNDPDCLLVRSDRNRMTEDQIKALATVIALSGGMIVISDNMQTISPDRVEYIQKVLQNRSDSMVVIDQHKSFEPDVVVGRTSQSLLFGLFNFTNKRATRIFDLKDLMTMEELSTIREIRDVWSGKELKHQNGLLRIGRIEPNSARLLEALVSFKG